MTLRIRHTLTACLALALIAANTRAAQTQRLSPSGQETGAPRIAADIQGHAAVVWTSRHATMPVTQVQIAQRHNGAWQTPQAVCPFRSNLQLRDPVVALAANGSPRCAWVADSGDSSRLEYGVCRNGRWVAPRQLASRPGAHIERPDLLLGRDGTMFLVWQEREGSLYRIRAGVVDTTGTQREYLLTGHDKPRYTVYPILLKFHAPDGAEYIHACWYDLEREQPVLRLRQWNPKDGNWRDCPQPEGLGGMLNSLPVVSSTHGGTIVLAGYESDEGRDRVFAVGPGSGKRYLDDTPDAQTRFPRLSRPNTLGVGIVWQRERPRESTLVTGILQRSGLRKLETVDVDPFAPSRPDVALTGDSLILAWTGLTRQTAPNTSGTNRLPAVQATVIPLTDLSGQ